jgi:glycosyltransferase involved in cell wall biosynthesis
MQNSTPLISIIITTYDRAHYIAEAIKSALSQNYSPMEVIVIDDGSTDDTESVIAGFSSTLLRYIKKEHTGAADTRNQAIKEAKGEFIIWLDSDDILLPGVLNAYSDLLSEYSDADVIYGDYLVVDNDDHFIRNLIYEDYYNDNAQLISGLLKACKLPGCGTLTRSSLYHEQGGYCTDYTRAYDYELWTRLAPHACFKHAGIVVYKWRWHDSNVSSNTVSFDKSYEVRIVKSMLLKFDLKQLFPGLDWDDEQVSLAQAYLNIGNIFIKWDGYLDGHDYLLKSVEISNQTGDIETLAAAYISIGNALLGLKKYDSALRYFQNSLDLVESDRAYFKLGVASFHKKDFSAAKSFFVRTLALVPDHSAAKEYLMQIEQNSAINIEGKVHVGV